MTPHLITPKILAIVEPDQFDRAMLFCRAQEFYESPNPKFRGQRFDIWECLKWHEQEYKESYTMRWEGFNVPFEEMIKSATVDNQTRYDEIIDGIIYLMGCSEVDYVIGVDALGSDIFKHEMAHALYATDEAYREAMKVEMTKLDGIYIDCWYIYLAEQGYAPEQIADEIQAYMVSGSEDFHEIYYASDKNAKVKVEEFQKIFTTFASWQK